MTIDGGGDAMDAAADASSGGGTSDGATGGASSTGGTTGAGGTGGATASGGTAGAGGGVSTDGGTPLDGFTRQADAGGIPCDTGTCCNHLDASALASLDDMLGGTTVGTALQGALQTTLTLANPLKPSACDSQTCTFQGCICWYSSKVAYVADTIGGPIIATATPVTGGVAVSTTVSDIEVMLRVNGSVSGVAYDVTGTVRYDMIVDATFDTVPGQPVSLRAGSVSTTVTAITMTFTGLDAWILNNVVTPLAQGTLRDEVRALTQQQIVTTDETTLGQVIPCSGP